MLQIDPDLKIEHPGGTVTITKDSNNTLLVFFPEDKVFDDAVPGKKLYAQLKWLLRTNKWLHHNKVEAKVFLRHRQMVALGYGHRPRIELLRTAKWLLRGKRSQ